jgi:threonine dehydratase
MIRDFSHVEAALGLLRAYFAPSRLVSAHSLGQPTKAEVYLKVESELPTGSFKVRGAVYALLRRMQTVPISEVVASSTGNHGAAVAYAATLAGIRAKIFLPQNPNLRKRKNIADLGADIEEGGKDITEAFARASAYAERTGAYLLNDATDPDLPAGPATISCEILEQLPETTTIIVPVGDSALIRGVAFAARHLSPTIRVIGVQAEQAPAYYLSWKQGRVIETDSCHTIADGLATRSPVEENVTTIRHLIADMCLVTEQDLLVAVRRLAKDENLIAEPAGAAALAAYLARAAELSDDATVLIVSGGNIAPEVLASALHC